MLKDIVQKCEDLREEFTEDFKSMYSGEELERQVLFLCKKSGKTLKGMKVCTKSATSEGL